jgi:vitellogenic carboxypeptidase-like protein
VENGPQLLQADGSFKANPWSWDTNATMIYIDSPVGSGYSYVRSADGYASNEKTIGEELYTALYAILFQLFPQYAKNDFYIFGESYAGKYVPWLGYIIMQRNKAAPNKINLQGLGVGDGWVNPYYQTGSNAPFLYNRGLIDFVELETADGIYEIYKEMIVLRQYEIAQDFGNALLGLLVFEAGNVDVYDIRYFNGDPTDPLQDALQDYLNEPAVRSKMNAGSQEWQACASAPYFALLNDISRSSEYLFPILLSTYRVLLYNGNYDLICNMDGTSKWASVMNWPYQNQFNSAKNVSWVVDSQPAGYYKTAHTLTHLIVYNAGHMCPFDQPRNTHDMLYRFIANRF